MTLINKNYRLLLTAYFLSTVGDWLYRLAIPILIFHLTHSALAMSIAYALTFLPFIVVTPFGGVIADRVNRRKMMMYGDWFAAIATLCLALQQTFLSSVIWPIYPLVFAIAALSSVYHPAFQSFIPEIVERDSLSKANSYLTSSDNLISLLGPLASGGLIAILGALNAIYINAASFALSAILITLITKRAKAAPHRGITLQSIFIDLKEGMHYAWKNAVIKYGCFLFLCSNFAIQVFYANFIFFLVKILKLTPVHVGVAIAVSGIGAIIGSLVAPRIGKHLAKGRIIVCCTIGAGLSTLLLLLARSGVTAGLAWGVVAAFNSVIIVTYFTLRQRVVPSEYLGRTVAITRLISYMMIPIASIFGGWVLQHHGNMQMIILLSSVVMTTGGVIAWFTPLNTQTDIESVTNESAV
ncbi:MAG: hypothetical protein COV52_02290 [Gammaproteobacteria bacterium CG11_big_fil_rev_8_21_14_0_20_46_22]|nr:MAG: hypothetical protein COW05_01285 [Gammaproteobacteria bacterium CG12_big_fil_rev_8_21_14_0_65_46_12]PIR11761.1 MAG: hypothetical protein COV52_02290 [Gammaproteobacteria bacterium CG11_big_fil_rev_8_21_14_0_20_46_22]